MYELDDCPLGGLVPPQEQKNFGVKEKVRVKGVDFVPYLLVHLEYFVLAPKLVQKHLCCVHI